MTEPHIRESPMYQRDRATSSHMLDLKGQSSGKNLKQENNGHVRFPEVHDCTE